MPDGSLLPAKGMNGCAYAWTPIATSGFLPAFGPDDLALVVESRFRADGLYVLRNSAGEPEVYRAMGTAGGVEVYRDDSRYARTKLTVAEFNERCLGKCAAIAAVADPRLMAGLMGGGEVT